MPFMRGLFSRRGRTQEAAPPPVQAVAAQGVVAGPSSRSNMLGLKQVCTQVAEGLLAAGGRDLTRPDAQRLERMCLTNFTEEELNHLIESGLIFDAINIADCLIQRPQQEGMSAEQVFKALSPLFKVSVGLSDIQKRFAALQEHTGSQPGDPVAQRSAAQTQALLAILDQMRGHLGQLEKFGEPVLATSASQQGASSSRVASSKHPKPPQEKPLKLPSNWKKFYCPQASYSVGDLCNLLKKTDKPCYDKAHAEQILAELATHLFLGQENSTQDRMALCEAVLSVMTANTFPIVTFDGRSYDDQFFVTLAADLTLGQLTPDSSGDFRNIVIARLERLLRVSGDEVTQFSLRGEPCTRRDIEFWVRNIRNIERWVVPSGDASTALAQSLNQEMRANNNTQSVHNPAVMVAGNKVYDLLSRRAGKLPGISAQDLRTQIEGLFVGKNNREILQTGLNRVINDHEVSTSIGVPVTPANVLKMLWQYIQHHENPNVRESLKDALLIRFQELGGTTVFCHVGRLERLLDVPSGIDERMNVFGRQRQIQADVGTIAAAVNELELNAHAKVLEFERRVVRELVDGQGMDMIEVRPAMDRMIPGFMDDDDE